MLAERIGTTRTSSTYRQALADLRRDRKIIYGRGGSVMAADQTITVTGDKVARAKA